MLKVPNPDLGNRNGLTDSDLAYLSDRLGDVDAIWPSLGAEEAVQLFGGEDKFVPMNSFCLLSEPRSALILSTGFSYPEAWGRWTDGDSASITLRHATDVGDLILILDVVMAHVEPGLQGAPIGISVNSQKIYWATIVPGCKCEIKIPASQQQANGRLHIQMLIPKPTTKDRLKNDPRQLGFGIASLCLQCGP